MSKLIATQISPELRESPLLLTLNAGYVPEYIGICGNNSYNEHLAPIVDNARYVLHDAADDFIDEYLDLANGDENRCFDSATKMMQWYFKTTREYTIEDVGKVREVLCAYWERDISDREALVYILTVVTGEEWVTETIRGSSQGDWNYLYFVKSRYTREDIDNIEIEYFNEGDEWLVTLGTDGECDRAYTHAWNDEDTKKEIAECYGVDVADVVLRKIAGQHTVYDYEEV